MGDSRVLITTYPTAFLNRGGGELELLDILSNLRQLGVRADIYGPNALPMNKYDVVLHYSIVPSGMEFVREAKSAGKKLILMPSIWRIDEPSASEKASAAEFIKAADVIVFKSKSECENVSKYMALDQNKLAFCKWGVDSCFEEPVENKDLFKSAYKLEKYLLWVGMIDERKNQLTAIHALKDLEIPLVFIGDYRERSYYESCVKAAPSSFKFLPHFQPKSEMLRSALQSCTAYIETSFEPPGFSAFEAALSKVPMVLSQGEWTDENFGNLVFKADPKSIKSIRQATQSAIVSTVNADLFKNTRINHVMPQSLDGLVRVLQLRK